MNLHTGVCGCGRVIEEAAGTNVDCTPTPGDTYRRERPTQRGYLCLDCKLDARGRSLDSPYEPTQAFEDILAETREQQRLKDERKEYYD